MIYNLEKESRISQQCVLKIPQSKTWLNATSWLICLYSSVGLFKKSAVGMTPAIRLVKAVNIALNTMIIPENYENSSE